MPVTFIAEVSSNHARDLSRALAFVDAAADAGCDAVKFQLFRIDALFAPEILARSAQHRARRDWEMPVSFVPPLAERAARRGLAFSCTPFYLEAVAELEPYVAFYKIASYELPWDDLIVACARTGKPTILSTGMATLDEVTRAAQVYRAAGGRDLSFLHCVSAYPTPPEQTNLAAIATIREATGAPCGWSDHTTSPGVLHRAIHKHGAHAVEFHLDLDRTGAEFSSGHCWLPETIAPVIAAVRAGEAADGDGVKRPVPAELSDRDWRADPSDGLRPFKHIRAGWRPEAA